MQYGGWGKVMQLEAVELQELAEERIDWKSESPQQIGDKAYSLPLGWVLRTLRLLPAIISG